MTGWGELFPAITRKLAVYGITANELVAIEKNIVAAAKTIPPSEACPPEDYCWLVAFLTLSLHGELYRPRLYQDLVSIEGGTFRPRFNRSREQTVLPVHLLLYRFILRRAQDSKSPAIGHPAAILAHGNQRMDFEPILRVLGFRDPSQLQALCQAANACFERLRRISRRDERGRVVKGLPSQQLVPAAIYYTLTRVGSRVPGMPRSQNAIAAASSVSETTVRAGWHAAQPVLDLCPEIQAALDAAARVGIPGSPPIPSHPTCLVDRHGTIRFEGDFYEVGMQYRGSKVFVSDNGRSIEIFDASMTPLVSFEKPGWLSGTSLVDSHGRLHYAGKIFRMPRLAGAKVRVVFKGKEAEVLSPGEKVLAILDLITGRASYPSAPYDPRTEVNEFKCRQQRDCKHQGYSLYSDF